MPRPAHDRRPPGTQRGPACEGHEKIFDRSGRCDFARQALAVCRTCDLLAACRSWSLAHDVGPAVAGGMTAAERRSYRRHRNLADPSPPDLDHVHTLRQRVADADDPTARREFLAAALGGHSGGPATETLAATAGVTVTELRRVRSASLAARRRADRTRRGTQTAPNGRGVHGSGTAR